MGTLHIRDADLRPRSEQGVEVIVDSKAILNGGFGKDVEEGIRPRGIEQG